MSDEQTNKIMELMALTKQIEAFEFDGVIFEGYKPESIKSYVMTNQSRSFYVWLHDTHRILNPSNNKK